MKTNIRKPQRKNRGFTLVEILIVVIILGILAAIVIPQFTNASNEARNSSVASTLQTIRSQLSLFKIQHGDTPPQGSTYLWALMTTESATADTATVTPTGTDFGPYLQQVPINPINQLTTVSNSSSPSAAVGWYYTTDAAGNCTIEAMNTTGTAPLTY